MLRTRTLLVIATVVFVYGCAGVGVVETSDPSVKLNDARHLYTKSNRPIIAERLIHEAIAIFEKQGDPHGLGKAYLEYGELLQSEAVAGYWQKYYRENGFRDHTVTFSNRVSKADEYFTRALEYFKRAELRLRETGPFDALTNVYYNMAYTSIALGDRPKACVYYDQAMLAYAENIKRNPNAKPYAPPGQTFPDVVKSDKSAIGCS